jgi:hypothetical protein
MRWSHDFTALFMRFARIVSDVGGIDSEDVLRTWTPLYLNLDGLDRSFDPVAPVWQEFLSGLRASQDPVAWTHSFYLEHSYDYPTPAAGCFSWSYEESTRTVRFHFYGNGDTSGDSPIAAARQTARMEELRSLFRKVQGAARDAQAVRGRSWLYNVPAYCRLFPPEYIRSAVQVEPELQFMSLWGQFLDRTWNVRPRAAEEFLRNLAVAETFDAVRGSFPLPVRAPRCEIEHFYRYYGLTGGP